MPKSSFSSLTSTLVELHANGDAEIENDRRPRNWWQKEIERVMQEEEQGFADEDTIKRLRQFGLADAQPQAVPSSSSTVKENFPDWKWVESSLKDRDAYIAVLCSKLNIASFQIVNRLRFADAVRRAFGFSSTEIDAFISHYDNFSLELNKFCSQDLGLLKRLLSLRQVWLCQAQCERIC